MPDPRVEVRAEARRKFGEAVSRLWLMGEPVMKIKDIASRSGFSATTVSDVLHGKRFPSKDVAQCIVTALGRDFEEIVPLWLSLSESVHQSVPVAPAGVQDELLAATWYHGNSEFYAAAQQGIDTATREIRLTYIRQYPPSDVSSSEAAQYFAAVLEWAKLPGARSVNRIFGVPTAGVRVRRNILDYLRQHLAEIELKKLKNYQARVFEYSALGDGLNMAVFDQEVSLLAVSGHGPQNLTGMRVDNVRFATYLISYFDQLLLGSEPLPEYLDRIDAMG
ncbi:MAG: helix-turn-helix domain-containing protein [Pseudonocardiaceae bacterium]